MPRYRANSCLGFCVVLAAGAVAEGQELPLLQPSVDEAPSELAEGARDAPVPVGVDEVPDAAIEQRLRTVFSRIEELRDVKITVAGGVVQLEGTATTAEAEKTAERIAGRLQGVLYVDNDLKPPARAEDQIAPALVKVRQRVQRIVDKLPLLGIAAIVIFVGYLLGRLIRGPAAPGGPRKNPLLRSLYRLVLGATVMITAVVLALDLLQATALVSAVLGAAGVLGLTMGLALRGIAENYLASVLLSLRRPFAPSDLVKIGEQEGRVMRLTTRDTTLMTLEGNSVRMPNATVFKSVITNYTRNPLRQFDVMVGVASHQSLLEAQRIGVEALTKTPGVADEPPPFARVEAFGSSYMELRLFGWVDQREADWWKVRSEALRHLKGAFEVAGIELPAPALRVERVEQVPPLDAPASRTDAAVAAEDLTCTAQGVAQDDHLQRQMDLDQAETNEEDLLTQPVAPPSDRE